MQSTNSDKPQFQNMPPAYKILELDPVKEAAFNQRLKDEQNFGLAILAGGFAVLLSSIFGAMFAVISGYKTPVAGLFVGLVVSFTIRKFGKGIDERFRNLAKVYAALGCLLGDIFVVIGITMQQTGASLLRVIWFWLTHAIATTQPVTTTFNIYNLVLYGFALYAAHRFSLRIITEEEKESLLREKPRI